MSEKTFFIDAYFEQWNKDVLKSAELLTSSRFYLESILVLSCYIGAFASMRFPSLKDGEAYVKVVLEYSGKRDFFEQIDLLFLYQLSRSKLRDNGNFKSLKNHTEIVEALTKVYGTEEDIKKETRYVSPADVTAFLLAAAIPCFDNHNFQEKLPLFSLAELFYRYLRCDAVHNADFPFVNIGRDIDGNTTYEHNHIITGQVLFETTQDVRKQLWEECRAKEKWPYEL